MMEIFVYLLVVGTLIALAARVSEGFLRLAQRPVRVAWAGGLLLLVVLAAWSPFRIAPPPTAIAAVTAVAPDGAAPRPVARGVLNLLTVSLTAARNAIADAPDRLIAVGRTRVPAGVSNVLAGLWALMSLSLIILLLAAYVRFRRSVARLPITHMHGEVVHVSPKAGPAVVGIVRPAIVVPHWLLEASNDAQQATVAHEREHLAARDPLLLLTGCAVVALLPWHPAAWWMLARLRLAVEMDCDRRVLAFHGVARRAYGSALIDIAARCARLPAGVPALVEHTTQLERRLLAMTPAPMPFRRVRSLSLGAIALLTAAAACETRLPSSPAIERMDAASVQSNQLLKTTLGPDSSLIFYVDGKRVMATEAWAVAPEKIASIEVTRSPAAGDSSSLRITTRQAIEREVRERADAEIAMAGKVMLRKRERPTSGNDADMVSVIADTLAVQEVRQRRSQEVEAVSKTFLGLVFIDGARADRMAMARLTPDQIESVEVIKGAAALRLYGEPEAVNGVIRVTTKKAR
jgi:beta-lactamase regulating signal transducer with metallopeptidase domain